MSFNRAGTLLALASLTALASCNTANSHIGDEDAFMGEALKYDTALQTINPTPVYPPNAAKPGDNGDKGAHATKRYRTDSVKQLETYTTSAGSTGSPH